MSRRQVFLGAAALFIAPLLAYMPAYQAGFVWDDDQYVTTCEPVRAPGGLPRIWFEPGATPQYYPLVFTTFWLEHAAWGLNPTDFHVVNVALHGISAVLLWLLLRRLALPGAWFAAAVFALHPVHAESVAWITERKNTLSGLFYLLALAAYLRFRPLPHEPAARPGGIRFYVLTLLAFTAALLSKTVVSSFPAALLLLTWWKRGAVTRRDVWPLLPLFALGAALAAMTFHMERQHVHALGPEWEFTGLERILIAGRAVWFYAGKLLLPLDLSFVYHRWPIDTRAGWQYLYPLAAVAVLVLLWLGRRRLGRGPLVAVLFFGGTLFPVLGLVNYYYMRYALVADHFQYLPSLGMIALVVATIAVGLRRLGRTGPIAGVIGGAVVLSLYAGGVWQRCRVFHDVETLWTDTIARDPDCKIAHYNLGNYLKSHGRLNEAVPHFEAAVRIRPEDGDAQNNLGAAYVELGRFNDAERHLDAALRLTVSKNPEFTHFNLALVYRRLGRLDEATDQLIDGLQINPNVDAARGDLARLLLARVDSYVEAGQLPQAAEFVRAKREWADFAGGPALIEALNAKLRTPAPTTIPAPPASHPSAP